MSSHKREMMRMLRDNPEWSNHRLVEEYIDRHYPDLTRSTLERYARRVRWAHEIAEERAEEEREKMYDEITELRERLDKVEARQQEADDYLTEQDIKDNLRVHVTHLEGYVAVALKWNPQGPKWCHGKFHQDRDRS